MPTIDVGGDRLHFTDEGEGPLLLFVHGSCGGSGQWKNMCNALGPGFRKIRVDLLGMGGSEPFPLQRVWKKQDDERAISALIDHLDAPLHFVGHSAGCIFSWPALQRHADRILSLTLFEPVFFDLLQEAGDPLEEWPRRMAEGYRARVEAGDQEGAIALFVDGWAGAEGTWEALPEAAKSRMRPGAARLYHEWAERIQPAPHFVAADVVEPAAPTLLAEGSETNAAVKTVCELFAAARPGTGRLVIEGAGHMAPFTHASEAAAATAAHIGFGG